MNSEKLYTMWLNADLEDLDLARELENIKGNTDEINDRFYRNLEFATAGLRGVIGAGTNRMNIYTVRQATQGYANYIKKITTSPKAVIAYDSRIKSELFAKESAKVLSANGIKTYIFSELAPTPLLSYAVRNLGCDVGINITASHNPSKYNGYKAYSADGSQISPEVAEKVTAEIEKIDIFTDVKICDFNEQLSNGMIEYVSDEVSKSYLYEVQKMSENSDVCKMSDIKICYTPLNGAGNKYVRQILKNIGIANVTVVPEQENPDGNFTTCPYPNPEEKEALALGLSLSKKIGADLLIATDPDSDRVGIAVRDGDDYRLITGNELGALLLYYIAESKTKKGIMPKDAVAIKSIVSTELARAICNDFKIKLIDVLTGFKFVGEQITQLAERGEQDRFIFAFEESYGYLAGSYARDKDAVVGSMLISEMACYYKSKGKTIAQQMEFIYEKYGCFTHQTKSVAFEGEIGMHKMRELMKNIRQNPIAKIADVPVIIIKDYETQIINDIKNGTAIETGLPKTNAIAYILENGASVVIRPSGTEPKVKFYYTAKENSKKQSYEMIEKLEKSIKEILAI
ncbi:MAG: phospho-sugar mutase [Oscillospiraceae bacterium]|nr:phospho-sugar mutase [Oscillospiraceae bacterium]